MEDTDRGWEVGVDGVWEQVMVGLDGEVGVVRELGVVKVSAAARGGADLTKQYSHVKRHGETVQF